MTTLLIATAMLPFAARLIAQDLAALGRFLGGSRGSCSEWGSFAALAESLSFCATRDERVLLGREAAKRSRHYGPQGPFGARLGAFYRALAFLAFRASRWSIANCTTEQAIALGLVECRWCGHRARAAERHGLRFSQRLACPESFGWGPPEPRERELVRVRSMHEPLPTISTTAGGAQ